MTAEYHFRFSLYPNDLIKIKKKDETEFYGYYISTDRSNATMTLLRTNGSERIRGVGVKRLEVFEKYQVDVLGNINKIKGEKREGVKQL